jgi:hypothetical protein
MADTVEDLCWWADKIDDAERCRRAVKAQQLVANLPTEMYRRDRDISNIRLYENNSTISLYQYAGAYYSDASAMELPVPEQSNDNKAKAAIDTLASQIASTETRARFKVTDGTSAQRRRARELQEFADGLSHDLGLHKLEQRAFFDAAVLESGVGAIQIYRNGKRVAAQRVLATELTIQPKDGLIDGMPRTLYRRRPVPRDQVMASFGDTKERKAAIATVPAVANGDATDEIDVFECWHLRSDEEAEDGWHLVGLDCVDGDLQTESFKAKRHDIVFFALEDRFTTGWGRSCMSQVRGLQISINANRYRRERADKLFHAGHLYVNKNAKMAKATFSNEIGSVWEGMTDTPPQQLLYNSVTEQFIRGIERDGQLIFENLGISVDAALGEVSAGLDQSGAAKREEVKKSDKRNSVRQQRWERFHIELIHVALAKVREIVGEEDSDAKDAKKKAGGSYVVSSPGKAGLSKLDWREIKADEDDYVLESMPASPIPQTPEGLVALGDRMIELGAWKPSMLAGYMQDLDANGRVNRDTAKQRTLEETFEALLYDKVAAALPDEFTDFQMAMELGLDYLAIGEAKNSGVPEKHLERLRRYLRRVKGLAEKAQAAAKGQSPKGPSAGPPAAPQPQGTPPSGPPAPA